MLSPGIPESNALQKSTNARTVENTTQGAEQNKIFLIHLIFFNVVAFAFFASC